MGLSCKSVCAHAHSPRLTFINQFELEKYCKYNGVFPLFELNTEHGRVKSAQPYIGVTVPPYREEGEFVSKNEYGCFQWILDDLIQQWEKCYTSGHDKVLIPVG